VVFGIAAIATPLIDIAIAARWLDTTSFCSVCWSGSPAAAWGRAGTILTVPGRLSGARGESGRRWAYLS
jgi:hypothetical protein